MGSAASNQRDWVPTLSRLILLPMFAGLALPDTDVAFMRSLISKAACHTEKFKIARPTWRRQYVTSLIPRLFSDSMPPPNQGADSWRGKQSPSKSTLSRSAMRSGTSWTTPATTPPAAPRRPLPRPRRRRPRRHLPLRQRPRKPRLRRRLRLAPPVRSRQTPRIGWREYHHRLDRTTPNHWSARFGI